MVKNRLPSFQQIAPVFSTILFINFSWSIGRMFWFLPSWLYFMTIIDLLPVLAYVLAFALFESLLILLVIMLLALLLPGKFLLERFVPQGIIMALLFTAATFGLHAAASLTFGWSPTEVTVYSLLIVFSVIGLVFVISYFLVNRVPVLEKAFISIGERMSVFLYIYFPLGVLGLFTVVFRNIP